MTQNDETILEIKKSKKSISIDIEKNKFIQEKKLDNRIKEDKQKIKQDNLEELSTLNSGFNNFSQLEFARKCICCFVCICLICFYIY